MVVRGADIGGHPPSAPTGRRRRAGWTVTDQILSTLSNFAASFVIARALPARFFGAYAVAYATYVIALTVSQATASEPLVIRYSSDRGPGLRAAIARSTGQALANGLVIGAVLATAGLLLGGPAGDAIATLGVLAPGLLLQDCFRFTFFASGSPRSAAMNDLVWCIGQAGAFALVLTEVAHPSVTEVMVCWGAGAWLAAVFGIIQTRMLPAIGQVRAWMREHRDLAGALVADGAMMNGGQQLASYVIALTGGLTQIAGFRGAQTLFGPVTVAYLSSRIFFIPEGVRLKDRDYGKLPRASRRVLAGMIGAGLAAGVVALVLPDSVGRDLLGRSWIHTRPLIPLFTVLLVLRGAQTAAMIGLRVLAAPRQILKARTRSAPLMVFGGAGGALLAGAFGAVAGLAIGQGIGAVIWWRQLRIAYRSGFDRPSVLVGAAVPLGEEAD